MNMAKQKFATKVSEEVLKDLRAYAREAKVDISDVVDEALAEYLRTVRVRPAFKKAVEEVISGHAEALRRLAK